MNENEVFPLGQKIQQNYNIALTIGYLTKDCCETRPASDYKTEDDEDLVWSMLEWLYRGYFNVMEGRCSLRQSIDCSMEEWECRVDNDYKELLKIKNYLGGSVWERVM